MGLSERTSCPIKELAVLLCVDFALQYVFQLGNLFDSVSKGFSDVENHNVFYCFGEFLLNLLGSGFRLFFHSHRMGVMMLIQRRGLLL